MAELQHLVDFMYFLKGYESEKNGAFRTVCKGAGDNEISTHTEVLAMQLLFFNE